MAPYLSWWWTEKRLIREYIYIYNLQMFTLLNLPHFAPQKKANILGVMVFLDNWIWLGNFHSAWIHQSCDASIDIDTEIRICIYIYIFVYNPVLILDTLLRTNISTQKGTFKDDCPFPQVRYVSSLEGVYKWALHHPFLQMQVDDNSFEESFWKRSTWVTAFLQNPHPHWFFFLGWYYT